MFQVNVLKLLLLLKIYDINCFFLIQNKPVGVCYVQMKSEESARKALKDLNKQYIENRYIEVFQVCAMYGVYF